MFSDLVVGRGLLGHRTVWREDHGPAENATVAAAGRVAATSTVRPMPEPDCAAKIDDH
jgi:hypothetical protein